MKSIIPASSCGTQRLCFSRMAVIVRASGLAAGTACLPPRVDGVKFAGYPYTAVDRAAVTIVGEAGALMPPRPSRVHRARPRPWFNLGIAQAHHLAQKRRLTAEIKHGGSDHKGRGLRGATALFRSVRPETWSARASQTPLRRQQGRRPNPFGAQLTGRLIPRDIAAGRGSVPGAARSGLSVLALEYCDCRLIAS